LGCGEAAVAGDDLTVLGHNDRTAESKALDRFRNVLNLRLWMLPRVSSIWSKIFGTQILNL
jgi:hypothetical protein